MRKGHEKKWNAFVISSPVKNKYIEVLQREKVIKRIIEKLLTIIKQCV